MRHWTATAAVSLHHVCVVLFTVVSSSKRYGWLSSVGDPWQATPCCSFVAGLQRLPCALEFTQYYLIPRYLNISLIISPELYDIPVKVCIASLTSVTEFLTVVISLCQTDYLAY